ncbi:hypothetical protein [Kordia zhangzhouensis]|uniref:hypothetical protein n=1 Tax=Kordia zhangzhouensis TaxID=1620405 RepID=UPI000629BFA2|nr:hypothetical protein [Kordia zhangzhouensis]
MKEEKFYIPKSYLTVQIVRDVMAEFEWPVSYELIDLIEDFQAVLIKFESCEIELEEIPDNGINLIFRSYNNGKELDAKYGNIIKYLDDYNPTEHLDLEYNTYTDPELDIITSVRNDMKNLQYYHMDFITGKDYSWAEKYLKDKNK